MMAKVLTPLEAIKAMCFKCSGNNQAEVNRCALVDCPLYVYRKGTVPRAVKKTLKEAVRK